MISIPGCSHRSLWISHEILHFSRFLCYFLVWFQFSLAPLKCWMSYGISNFLRYLCFFSLISIFITTAGVFKYPTKHRITPYSFLFLKSYLDFRCCWSYRISCGTSHFLRFSAFLKSGLNGPVRSQYPPMRIYSWANSRKLFPRKILQRLIRESFFSRKKNMKNSKFAKFFKFFV